MEKVIIGMDLGGTKVSVALFDAGGSILEKEKVELGGANGEEVGDIIQILAGEFREKARAKKMEVKGIGICVPGIAYQNGHVWAPNISGWEDYPLKEELESYFSGSLPVFIDNDRACHMLGEQWQGVAQGCQDAVFLVVGTGIGAGIFSAGQMIRGSHDIAGAIGWMGLNPNYQQVYQERGCFESHASGFGITKRLLQLIHTGEKSMLEDKMVITTEDVFEAYSKEDPLAVKVINEAILYWGMAVANLVSLLNPEKIIFGGGVFGPAAILLNKIYDEAMRWSQPISIRQVKLEISKLQGDAGLYGAARLVK